MRVSVKLSPAACLLLAVLLLTVPISWVAAALFAGYIHELCHIIVIILCRGTIHSVSVGAFGAKIHTSPLSELQEFACAVAGPLGSFAMLLFLRWIPRLALCGLIQGLFNLLPVYPMDGGRIFRLIAEWMRRRIGKRPCKEAKHRVQ